MHNEVLPRILFQSVPERIAGDFENLPGTHTFIGAKDKVHPSDHDLLVTFERRPLVDSDWHVLGFGLGYVDFAGVTLVRRSPDNHARAFNVAENAIAKEHRALIEQTILPNIQQTPRATWAAVHWSQEGFQFTDAEHGDLGGRVVPLVHLGQEKYVYGHVAERHDGRLTWALPPETGGHREWVLHVLDVLHRVDAARFPGEPDWQAGTTWATPDLARAHEARRERVAERDRLVAQAEQDIADASARIQASRDDAAAGVWRLLTEDGDQLVHAVLDALTTLGFDVEELDEEHHKVHGRRLEDLRVTDPAVPEWESLVEVKGYAKGAKANDVHQVTQAPTTYFAMERGRPPRTVWHVVNVQRGTDPSTRATALPSDGDLQALTDAPGALIDTRDLFRAWHSVVTHAARPEDVRASLRDALTRWTWPSTHERA
ncbi:hypothetical protein [Cellulosimicrobium sp. NPDC057862]|uniref:hypothetical protein n=1 Tax=Cellulosimicrobium sp. NPDC057862 TaxID=3346266 RepID=UPI00366F8B32